MENHHRITKIALFLLSTLLLLLLWGTAAAQNKNNSNPIQGIAWFADDITIADQQIVNNATVVGQSLALSTPSIRC